MKRILFTKLGFAVGFLVAVAIIRWLRGGDDKMVGSFLGIPYDLRSPTPRVLRERLWNRDDPRVFTPHVLGWGWSINFHALGRRLGLLP